MTKNKIQTNPNNENSNSKPVYDLEERTFQFAKNIRLFVKTLPKSMANFEDGKQLLRASGSVGANYIEANESLGRKDFLMRIKISRKEAKESMYWLRLIYDQRFPFPVFRCAWQCDAPAHHVKLLVEPDF